MEQLERMARAICIADNVDPDVMTVGMGVQLPAGEPAPMWKARLKQAAAARDAYWPEQVRKALDGELGL